MTNLDKIKQVKSNNCFSINGYSPKLFFVIGNRDIDQAHTSNIEKAMINNQDIPPVLVNENDLKIIDGQHRYSAACRLWNNGNMDYELTICLVNSDNTFKSAIEYNSNSKKFSTLSYITGHMKNGNDNYLRLYEFCKNNKEFINSKNDFQFKAASQLILGTYSTENIRNGRLIITDEQINNANIRLIQLRSISNLLYLKSQNKEWSDKIFKRDNISAFYSISISKQKFNEWFNENCYKFKHLYIPDSDRKKDYLSSYNKIINS